MESAQREMNGGWRFAGLVGEIYISISSGRLVWAPWGDNVYTNTKSIMCQLSRRPPLLEELSEVINKSNNRAISLVQFTDVD